MLPRSRPLLALSVVLMITLSAVVLTGLDSSAPDTVMFPGGETEITDSFHAGHTFIETHVSIPSNSAVSEASFSLLGRPDANDSYPSQLSVNVGDDDVIDWMFGDSQTSQFALGNQRYFSDNAYNKQIILGSELSDNTTTIKLPKGAMINSAKMSLSTSLADYWSPVAEINPINEGIYSDYDPVCTVFNDKLVAVWTSYNPDIHNRSGGIWDRGVVVSTSTNGLNWSAPVEITGINDTGTSLRPSVSVFAGKLFVVWESNSTEYCNPNKHGDPVNDYDLLISWSATPDVAGSWADPVDITNDPEQTYSIHTNAWEWNPKLEAFSDRLFLTYETNDTGSDLLQPGEDIMVAQSANGKDWEKFTQVTPADSWAARDQDPYIYAHGERLFIAWWSNNDNFTGSNITYDIPDSEILLRYSSDGENWGSIVQITPDDKDGMYHKYWNTRPQLIGYQGRLNCIWRTNDIWTAHGTGSDSDIVVAQSTNDEGTQWTQVSADDHTDAFGPDTRWGAYRQVSREDDPYSTDAYPFTAVFQNRLYCLWESDDVEWTYKFVDNPNDNDLLVSYSTDPVWDIFHNDDYLTTWSDPADVCFSRTENGWDYWPSMVPFGDRLFFIWNSYSTLTTHTWKDDDILGRYLQISKESTEISLDIGGDGSRNWGPRVVGGSPVEVDIKDALNKATMSLQSFEDEWGNEFVEIPVVFSADGPTRLTLEGLDIYYDSEVKTSNLAGVMNDYLDDHRGNGSSVEQVDVPVKITSQQPGTLVVSDLMVHHSVIPEIRLNVLDKNNEMAGETYEIMWSDADPDSDADVRLYYKYLDSITGSQSWNLINSEPVSEDDPTDRYIWITGEMVPGNYSLRATIQDEASFKGFTAPHNLTIIRSPNVPRIQITSPSKNVEVSHGIEIQFVATDSDDDARINLYYDTDSDKIGGTLITANLSEDRDSSYTWEVGDLPVGSYYIYATISDDDNHTNYAMAPGLVIRVPPDTISPPENIKLVTDHSITPTFEWDPVFYAVSNSVEYIIDVYDGDILLDHNIITQAQGGARPRYTIGTQSAPLVKMNHPYTFMVRSSVINTFIRSEWKSVDFTPANAPPLSPSIELTWNTQSKGGSPTTDTDIHCVVDATASMDPDGDDVLKIFTWFRDGKLYRNQSTTNNRDWISYDNTMKGEEWTVRVTLWDGFVMGQPAENKVTIANSPPREPTINHNLPDRHWVTGESFTLYASASDPDPGDNLTYTWMSNLDGDLGTGRTIAITMDHPGIHYITLTVDDGTDQVQTNITMEVDKGTDSDDGIGNDATTAVGIIIIVILIFLILWQAGLLGTIFNNMIYGKSEEEKKEDDKRSSRSAGPARSRARPLPNRLEGPSKGPRPKKRSPRSTGKERGPDREEDGEDGPKKGPKGRPRKKRPRPKKKSE